MRKKHFFGTSEIRSHIDTHSSEHGYVYYIPKLDGDNRVSSCYTIIQKILFSYPWLNNLFEHAATGTKKVVFANMSVNY